IICRCEKITKQEILDAIANPLGARTLVSIKYRARASMGRCQGGFCVPRITRILRDEFGWKPEDFLMRGAGSPLFVGNVRPEKGGAAR
ncbi:(2Fe-2S)-binding protein, partial [Aminivibrio sp.]|uniref:(2Fe-2S)-binding protein n=1 Tax=Aminivibrio sp. TaxID=1872489 RepID=UPI001A367968